MVDPPREPDSATYEIRIRGDIPPELQQQIPGRMVGSSPTETVLYRDVRDLAELDLLLEQLQSMGLLLCELRQSARTAPLSGSEAHHG